MSHKKAGGSTANGRDSQAKRLGIKVFGGQIVRSGAIIVRQRGTKYFPGENTKLGRDHTIFSLIGGKVNYTEKTVKKYDGRIFHDKFVNVLPVEKA